MGSLNGIPVITRTYFAARRLSISRFTARNHAEQIFARLKVESRWQVARALWELVKSG